MTIREGWNKRVFFACQTPKNKQTNVQLQVRAEESMPKANLQDLARGIAQRTAQQKSSSFGAIQPKDAVAAAKAGKALLHMTGAL